MSPGHMGQCFLGPLELVAKGTKPPPAPQITQGGFPGPRHWVSSCPMLEGNSRATAYLPHRYNNR